MTLTNLLPRLSNRQQLQPLHMAWTLGASWQLRPLLRLHLAATWAERLAPAPSAHLRRWQ
jgi:hypothetical protein